MRTKIFRQTKIRVVGLALHLRCWPEVKWAGVIANGAGLASTVVLLLLAMGCLQARAQGGADFVGDWKLDESNGMMASDTSGYGHHGTLLNGPTWSSGRCNGGLTFDGIDDFVQVT